MSDDQLRDLFTHGGCGILVQEILALRPDGVPVVWRDAEGCATHAAALVGGRLLHYGDREDGYAAVTAAELTRCVDEDFDPRMDADECRAVAREVARRIVDEL